MQYRITVTQLVYEPSGKDLETFPAGEGTTLCQRAYYRDDDSEKEALEWFNCMHPIENHDDFSVEIEEQDIWKEDPEYQRDDWHNEVLNDDTILGYWDWVEHQKEMWRD